MLRSPSGILFRVELSRFVDAYETVLTGVPHMYIFPLLETGYVSDSTVFFEVTGMQQGLPWPRIGWELISFDGTVCRANQLLVSDGSTDMLLQWKHCIASKLDSIHKNEQRTYNGGIHDGR